MQERSRVWFCGRTAETGQPEEYDEDMEAKLQDIAEAKHRTSWEEEPYCYNETDINELLKKLGIRWEKSKTIPFQEEVPFLGFSWDLRRCMVAVLEEKKQKYWEAIKEWKRQDTHTLEQVQSLYGKLLHTTLVVPRGRAYLTNLEKMLGTYNNAFVPHHPPRHLRKDLVWWHKTLSEPVLARNIPTTRTIHNIKAYLDTSSGFGVAVTIGKCWQAWRLCEGWNAEDWDIGDAKLRG